MRRLRGLGQFSSTPNYDQRDFAFARVVGGRIDIGAVEAGAVSADSDLNGVVSGRDFLRWQLGFGTTGTAVHGDEDANSDGSVDSDNLGIWELQYGTAAPLVAAATTPLSPASVFTEPIFTAPIAVPSLSKGDLVDVALAVELASETADEEETALDNKALHLVQE